ncbi:hypothetical protein Tco_1540085 [Tanacetum coccineum]
MARHIAKQDYGVTTHKVYAETLLLWKDESFESALRRNVDTYAITSLKPARWKVHVSSLRRKPLKDLRGDQGLHSSKNFTRSLREITLNLLLYLIVHKQLLLWFHWKSFDYRVTLDFGSIASGLDHVNPVIRLPLEHGIIRILGKVDHPNPIVGTNQFLGKFLWGLITMTYGEGAGVANTCVTFRGFGIARIIGQTKDIYLDLPSLHYSRSGSLPVSALVR